MYKFHFVFQNEGDSANTYSIDHCYPGAPQSPDQIILYGQIGTPEFVDFHEKLKSLVEKKKISYILRHYVKVRTFTFVIVQLDLVYGCS